MMPKLTTAQQHVLDELRKPDARAIYIPYMGRYGDPYWFLSTTYRGCTKQITALAKLGLVKIVQRDTYGFDKIAIAVEPERFNDTMPLKRPRKE